MTTLWELPLWASQQTGIYDIKTKVRMSSFHFHIYFPLKQNIFCHRNKAQYVNCQRPLQLNIIFKANQPSLTIIEIILQNGYDLSSWSSLPNLKNTAGGPARLAFPIQKHLWRCKHLRSLSYFRASLTFVLPFAVFLVCKQESPSICHYLFCLSSNKMLTKKWVPENLLKNISIHRTSE